LEVHKFIKEIEDGRKLYTFVGSDLILDELKWNLGGRTETCKCAVMDGGINLT
jgi:hypothetical protein